MDKSTLRQGPVGKHSCGFTEQYLFCSNASAAWRPPLPTILEVKIPLAEKAADS